jgi:rod shape-determining protein MreC
MDLKSFRSLIIPTFIALALLWVFNRPISAFALFTYNGTGAILNIVFENLKATQKEAADLLAAQKKADDLTKKNQILILENTKLTAKLENMDRLEAALNFKSRFPYKTIPAKIIGRSPSTWHKQVIINKGSSHGVSLGKGVVTEKGVIGQIQKVSPYSSIVQLVYNTDWRMGVKISGLGKYGVLSGNYPEPAFLQFITVDSNVKVGDEILTSGICIDSDNCPYPENFPVAKVISVSRDPNIVDLVVKVQFDEDLSAVREVFVLN